MGWMCSVCLRDRAAAGFLMLAHALRVLGQVLTSVMRSTQHMCFDVNKKQQKRTRPWRTARSAQGSQAAGACHHVSTWPV